MSSTIDNLDFGRVVFEAAPELMLILDKEGKIVSVNDYVKQSIGTPPEQWQSLFPTEAAKVAAREVFEEALEGEQKTTFVNEIELTSGKCVVVEWVLKAFNEGLVAIGRDVTKRNHLEAQLRESEQQLRNIIEHSINWFYSHTPEHKLTYLSPQVKDILGYTPEEAKVIWTELTTDNPINQEGFEITQKAIKTGEAQPPYFLELRHKKGHPIWVEVREKPVVENGKTVAIVGSVTDVTERRKVENALRESEERLHLLADAAIEGIFIMRRGSCIEANSAAAKMFGYGSPAELIGCAFSSFISEESLGANGMDALTDSSEPREASGMRRDGTEFPVTIQFKRMPYKDIGDASVASVRDISELREQQRRFQIIAEASADIIYEWDIASDELLWHGNIDGELGYDVGKIEHTIAGWLKFIHPDDIPTLSEAVDHHRKSVEPIEFTYRVRRKDGTWAHWQDRGYPVVGADGLPKKWIGACSDVTIQKNTEAQLRQSQKMEAVGRLAGGIAHDLNNLLTPILGYCQLLDLDLKPESVHRQTVLEIKNAGNRARDLVSQLLAFSRKQPLKKKNLSLRMAIQNVEKLLIRTIPENIHLKTDLAEDSSRVFADIGQLEQILLNLSINAADAMPDGGTLTIGCSRETIVKEDKINRPGLLPGTYATLKVSDTGQGMDKETAEHIFEPFFTTKGDHGTGLGLAMVYGIVKQHNGSIFVESHEGRGTTFSVFFNLVEVEDSAPEARAENTVEQTHGKETILLVEDNVQVRSFTERVLERFGYEVLSAEDGPSALETLEQFAGQVDLLFTDVFMPRMNGKELFDKISADYPRMKVLYMSGYSDNVIANRGVLDSNTHLIQKPYEIDVLIQAIRKLLD